jgi:UDP-glucose 4-epimerase
VKILVLGSNGFIGSNTLHYFRKKFPATMGCDVYPPAIYDERFLLLDHGNPEFNKVFLQNTFDICINASGTGSVQFSIDRPDEDYRMNAKNVFDILNAISQFNSQCRFINFSSAAVYGNPESLPISEKARTRPVSPYGFHKLISEQICAEFYHLKKIRTCSMRVFSAYGKGLRKQLFWDIYRKAKQHQVVELFGTGDEERDFIYIQDILNAIEKIIDRSSFEADVINVASGNSISIREAATLCLQTFGIEKSIRFNGIAKQGDPVSWQADIKKLESYGYTSAVNLEEGLGFYKDWILSQQFIETNLH